MKYFLLAHHKNKIVHGEEKKWLSLVATAIENLSINLDFKNPTMIVRYSTITNIVQLFFDFRSNRPSANFW